MAPVTNSSASPLTSGSTPPARACPALLPAAAGRLLTVFSAPDYPQFIEAGTERWNNLAAVAVLSAAGGYAEPELKTFEAVKPRPSVGRGAPGGGVGAGRGLCCTCGAVAPCVRVPRGAWEREACAHFCPSCLDPEVSRLEANGLASPLLGLAMHDCWLLK